MLVLESRKDIDSGRRIHFDWSFDRNSIFVKKCIPDVSEQSVLVLHFEFLDSPFFGIIRDGNRIDFNDFPACGLVPGPEWMPPRKGKNQCGKNLISAIVELPCVRIPTAGVGRRLRSRGKTDFSKTAKLVWKCFLRWKAGCFFIANTSKDDVVGSKENDVRRNRSNH